MINHTETKNTFCFITPFLFLFLHKLKPVHFTSILYLYTFITILWQLQFIPLTLFWQLTFANYFDYFDYFAYPLNILKNLHLTTTFTIIFLEFPTRPILRFSSFTWCYNILSWSMVIYYQMSAFSSAHDQIVVVTFICMQISAPFSLSHIYPLPIFFPFHAFRSF